jgi:hypothetical protein
LLTGTANVGRQLDKADAAKKYGEAAGLLGRPATSGIDGKYRAEVATAQSSIKAKLAHELSRSFPGRMIPEVLGFAADGRPVRLPPIPWPSGAGVAQGRIEDQK